MLTGEVQIVNKLGLHARAASKLVRTTKSFASSIRIGSSEGGLVDAKSIMAVMMLEAVCGAALQLSCDGADEDEAYQAVVKLFADRFGEAE